MTPSASYRDRVVKRLRALVESRGASIQAVERRMGRGRNYLGDALRGSKKLSFEVVLEVLEALGVAPEEFFERPTLEPARKGQRSKPGRDRLTADALPPELRDASPVVQAMLLLMLEKGLVGLDELQEIRRDLRPPTSSSPDSPSNAGVGSERAERPASGDRTSLARG